MYAGFGSFPVSPLSFRLLDGGDDCGKVDGGPIFAKHFHFRDASLEIYSRAYTFLARAPLYPLPYIHLIPSLCGALM